MDIEGFYDEDPRRRHSEELSFGREWRDEQGRRFELNWVEDTGEVYLMGEPMEPIGVDPLGDTWVPDMPDSLITVEILGVIDGRDAVNAAFEGWQAAMETEGAGGVAWIRAHLPA